MIDSFSSFYYGFRIDAQPYNGYMNIDEGGGEITVEVPVGSYTLTTLTDAIRNALLTQATLDYVVNLDRESRAITISATSNFDLLTNSGANSASSIWSLIGYNTGTDKTGTNSYTSDFGAGKSYNTQFKLQSYVPQENFQARNQSTKNVASNGTTVEVVNFGIAKFIEFDLKYITSESGVADFYTIRKNDTGLEDALDFLRDITGLNEFEFMPDEEAPGNFFRVIVESTPDYGDGTGYRLREKFTDNLRDIYETGIIRLRVIE